MKQLIKKYNLIIGVLLVCVFDNAKAQVNLVPNPSFEDTTKIVIPTFTQQCLTNWHNLDSLRPNNCGALLFSLYFNYQGNSFTLPLNMWGHTYPRNGNNIISNTNYVYYPWIPPPPTLRAVTSSRLKSKLLSNKKYCAKAWVTPADYEGYFTNGFGIYFDNGQLDTIVAKDSSGIYPFVTPQVQAPMLNDSSKWTLVSGTFTANGSETHIHLGNWLADSAMLFQPNNIGSCECEEIFIDDVSLIPVDIENWLRDTSVTFADSVYIGLPTYEVPDAVWYTINGVSIDTASGIWVKPTEGITRYIQAIDVCDKVAYDTVTVYAYPLSNFELGIKNFELKVFPNPATNVLTIFVNNLMNQSVVITNTSMQIVVQQNLQQPTTNIDISHWASGVYVVRYAGVVKKLVVQ